MFWIHFFNFPAKPLTRHRLWENPQQKYQLTLDPPCVNMPLIEAPRPLQRNWNIPVQDPCQMQILQELSAELGKAPTPSQKAAKNSTLMLKASKSSKLFLNSSSLESQLSQTHIYDPLFTWPSECVAEEGRYVQVRNTPGNTWKHDVKYNTSDQTSIEWILYRRFKLPNTYKEEDPKLW